MAHLLLLGPPALVLQVDGPDAFTCNEPYMPLGQTLLSWRRLQTRNRPVRASQTDTLNLILDEESYSLPSIRTAAASSPSLACQLQQSLLPALQVITALMAKGHTACDLALGCLLRPSLSTQQRASPP